LAPEVLEDVAEHLDSCLTCQIIVQTLSEGTDPLIAALRRPVVADPFAAEPACQQAVAHFGTVPLTPEASPHSPGEWQSPDCRTLDTIGQYQLLEKLGQGGMGTVYKATHTKLKRVVALKVLAAHRTHDSPAVARFQREMAAIGKLDHPNVVRATDAGEAGGTHFLVTEFLQGIDLARLVRQRGPLRVADACAVVRQAALGLQHAHEHGLVHRDVKPSNLLLTVEGRVKVLDLGLALLQGDPSAGTDLTTTGQVVGTLDYMAPEQASDTHAVDIRADIYSLGCTLYYLLTGQAPYGGLEHKHPVKKMQAHLEEPLPPLWQHRPEVPNALVAVWERLAAKDPTARFATPREVAAVLEPFTAGCHLSGLCTLGDGKAIVPLPGGNPVTRQASARRSPAMLSPLRATRGRIALVAAGLVLSAVAFYAGQQWLQTAGPSVSPVLEDFQLLIVRDGKKKPERFNLVSEGVVQRPEPRDPLRPKDAFRLEGRFRQATYCYVVWFDTAGAIEVEALSRQPQPGLEYPIPKDADNFQMVNPDDPKGVHLILVVAGALAPEAGKPLLEDRLRRARLGPAPAAPSLDEAPELRGAGSRRPADTSPTGRYLQAIKDQLPPGLEAVQPVFLTTSF
jgi:serine/threonine protein kinase